MRNFLYCCLSLWFVATAFADPPTPVPPRPTLPGIIPNPYLVGVTVGDFQDWRDDLVIPLPDDKQWFIGVHNELVGNSNFIYGLVDEMVPWAITPAEIDLVNTGHDLQVDIIIPKVGHAQTWVGEYNDLIGAIDTFDVVIADPGSTLFDIDAAAQDIWDAYIDLIGAHDDAVGVGSNGGALIEPPGLTGPGSMNDYWELFFGDVHDVCDERGPLVTIGTYINDPAEQDFDLWYGGTPLDWFVMPGGAGGVGGP